MKKLAMTVLLAVAAAEDIADIVAIPIEEEINTVEDVMYYESASDNAGNYTLTVTVRSGANPDMALVNVNNAVKRTGAAVRCAVSRVRRSTVYNRTPTPNSSGVGVTEGATIWYNCRNPTRTDGRSE